MEPLKKFSPGFYGIIILLFFLPFVNLSCSGQTIMSLSGFQLITGADYKANSMFGETTTSETKADEKIESQPLALFALLAAVIALAISFVKIRMMSLVNIVLSALGAIFLILLKINMDGDAKLSAQAVITLDYQFAYWLSIILFIAAAVIQWKIFADDGPVKVNVLE
jgi:hypothetical protein